MSFAALYAKGKAKIARTKATEKYHQEKDKPSLKALKQKK